MRTTTRRSLFLALIAFLPLLLGAARPAVGTAHQTATTTAATGEIAVRVYACPPGMRPETMVGDVCGGLLTEGFDLRLTTPAGTTLTLADAARDGGVVVWSGLPYGSFTLAETRLPAGHDVYVIDGPTPGPALIPLDGAAPRYAAAVYNFRPDPSAASLTIHNRLCPEGHGGTNLYRDCHETPTGAGLEFIATPVPTGTPTAAATDSTAPAAVVATTDLAGNATLTLPPGTYDLRGGVPGDFARLALFCAPAAAAGTRFPTTPLLGGVRGPNDPTGARLTLAAGDTVVCDWYNTPESQRG